MSDYQKVLAILVSACSIKAQYQPNWSSLNSRPLPAWYDESKFGIFCHWGPYSVPAMDDAWMWYNWKGPNPDPKMVEFMNKNYKPGFSYADFAPLFTAEYFDPFEFRKVIQSSGARYFVFTSKHLDGYTMWPSVTSWNWNSVDTGPKRDIVGELKKTFAGSGIHFGLYFSHMDQFNQLYLADLAKNFSVVNSEYVRQISYPQMLEIVNAYKPDLFWSDAAWLAGDGYWKSKEFLAWLYNNSPVKTKVVANDRWGDGDYGKNGGFLTFDDHYDPGHLIGRKWENCMTLDRGSWGYRRAMRAEDVRPVKELITQLARTISCNGNLLLNVGPTDHGIIVPIFQERLKTLGKWIKTNQEAIYGTKPWIYQHDGKSVWYTSRMRQTLQSHHNIDHRSQPYHRQNQNSTLVYAFVLDWPSDGRLMLPSVKLTTKTRIRMLGVNGAQILKAKMTRQGTEIDLSTIPWTLLPSFEAWVLKFEYLKTEERNPIAQLQSDGILDSLGLPVDQPIYTPNQSKPDFADDADLIDDDEDSEYLF